MKICFVTFTGVKIKPKIMFVDDSRSFVESILKFLKLDQNFEFSGIASTGREAIDKIVSDPPDIILMDLQMPGMDGLEATRIIKSSHPSIKIIIVTLHSDKEYMDKALSVGADGYIIKSRFVEEFYPLVNSLFVSPTRF